MAEVEDEVDQTIAPSANGKSPHFECEDVGSIPTGASIAPVDRCYAVPVPGKPGALLLFDKVTHEPFDVGGAIMQAFESGQCAGK
jgi:hypothetical protein